MQQVNNILLGSSSKSADVSSKANMQDVDNKSFLSALDQANESNLASQRNVNTTKNSFNTEVAKANVDIGTESSSEENADAEMIFAQLNMADSLNNRNAIDGKDLPLGEMTEGDFDATVLLVSGNDLVGNNSTDTIDLPVDFATATDALSQLSSEDLDKIMAFANLSLEDLQALDNQALNKLIGEFNLQSLATEPSSLAMMDNTVDNSDEVSDDIVMGNKPSEIDKSVAASVAIPGQASASGVNAAQVKSDMTRPLSSGVSGSATSLESASTMTGVDPKTILGDKTLTDGNIQLDTDSAKVLAKADFAVVLDSLAAKRTSADASVNANQVNLGMDALASASDTDNKALQNLSSLTPTHKSDVPQFQLSLRTQGEAGGQMQEMIQRFSPVMKQQLITMVSNGIQQAEIRLDPPELGHLTVKIQIQGDQTQVQFHVAQSQTRDIVEQAMPRLRDMLSQEGLQLTDSHVSQGDEGSEQQGQSSGQSDSDSQLDEISTQEVSLMTNPSRSLHSAIDYYA
ncbi:flagellar hook-length control protein FliK [Shewanella sp. MEBiC00475]|uniref:flagellar hook-length control protein FliK n=1 Tax=Shewanella sp. MEBiC00475 TaxID=2575361 RepID=UPI0020C8049A|nr:flagellar hook-length control protein FliK [Shewanella sp. MEBiC00475]